MRYADLHTHTYHSDGTRAPREVIDLARAHRLDILCISDHDNLAAYFEGKAYADSVGVTLVPGMELSCEVGGVDVHVLAYAFDPLDPRVDARLRHFRESRHTRGHRMIARLRELGYEVSAARVDELAAGGSMGRPHVARALVEARHVSSVTEAFDKLIGAGKPAYVEKERFRIADAVALIRSAGGVTSVAHPTIYPDHESLVPRLLDAGVDGIEVFHPEVNEEWRKHYTALARSRGVMTTGGSDDHGTVKTSETLGTIRVPETLIAPILSRL